MKEATMREEAAMRLASIFTVLLTLLLQPLAFAQPAQPVPQVPSSSAPPTPDTAKPAFGEAVDLPQRHALVLSGTGSWDEFNVKVQKALEQLERTAKAQGLLPAAPPLVRVETANDDTALFSAFLPIIQPPQTTVPLAPVSLGETPSGAHLKFTHLGSYDLIEQTYDEIANYLDEKSLIAEDYFVEEYPQDPNTTPETNLAVHIYVRLKAK